MTYAKSISHQVSSSEIFFCARISLEQNSFFVRNWNPGPGRCVWFLKPGICESSTASLGKKCCDAVVPFEKNIAVVWFFSVTLNYLILVCKVSKCIFLKNHMSSEIKKKLIMMNAFTEEEASANRVMRIPLYRSDIVWKIILCSWHPMLRPWLRSCGGDHVDVSATLRRPGNVSAGSFSGINLVTRLKCQVALNETARNAGAAFVLGS